MSHDMKRLILHIFLLEMVIEMSNFQIVTENHGFFPNTLEWSYEPEFLNEFWIWHKRSQMKTSCSDDEVYRFEIQWSCEEFNNSTECLGNKLKWTELVIHFGYALREEETFSNN